MNDVANRELITRSLSESLHMSMASSVEEQPWVVELHFAYDDKPNIYFRSLPDTRHCQEIDINHKVAGNVVKQHATSEQPYGIYFEGTCIQIVNERATAATILADRFGANKQEMIDESENDSGHQFYKVIVGNWVVFGDIDGSGEVKKHELGYQ